MILRSSKDADFGDVDGDASADVFGGYSKRALGLSLLADVLMSIGEVVVNRFWLERLQSNWAEKRVWIIVE